MCPTGREPSIAKTAPFDNYDATNKVADLVPTDLINQPDSFPPDGAHGRITGPGLGFADPKAILNGAAPVQETGTSLTPAGWSGFVFDGGNKICKLTDMGN